MKLRFWKDPYVIGTMLFGTLNQAIHPLMMTFIWSRLGGETIALQTFIAATCGIIATYLGQRYRNVFLKRIGFYSSCCGDLCIAFIAYYLYYIGIISLQLEMIISTMSFNLIGRLYSVSSSYLAMKYYCGIDEEETSNNKANFDKIMNYVRDGYCIVGSLIGFMLSYFIKDVSIVSLLFVSNMIFTVIVISDVIRFEVFRKCL